MSSVAKKTRWDFGIVALTLADGLAGALLNGDVSAKERK
jgi:hypothetical protein